MRIILLIVFIIMTILWYAFIVTDNIVYGLASTITSSAFFSALILYEVEKLKKRCRKWDGRENY